MAEEITPGAAVEATLMNGVPIAARKDATIDLAITPVPDVPVEESKWFLWRSNGTALVRYLLDSEVHTFAFSVAANAILSFIPFIVLLYKLAPPL